MSNEETKGYGVCRSVEDAHTIAEQAKAKGVGGCYPSAAVVLSEALKLMPTLEVVAPFDYQAEAMSTASNQFHGDMVALSVFDNVLSRCVLALRDLDAIKKTLFYGKPLPDKLQIPGLGMTNCNGLPDFFKSRSFGELALHGIIGSATENGELLETIFAVMRGEDFDEVNIKEEVGDSFWYNAILLHAVGSNFNEVQHINIEKLKNKAKGRYKSGTFTETAALQRDLVAERQILEK